MTDTQIDGLESFDKVKTTESTGFRKTRYRHDDTTVDISIIDTDTLTFQEYVDDRKDELQNPEAAVPTPYTAEKEEKQTDTEPGLFTTRDGHPLFQGKADPEYRLVTRDTQLERYHYAVEWRETADAILEIAVYLPDSQAQDTTRDLLATITVEE